MHNNTSAFIFQEEVTSESSWELIDSNVECRFEVAFVVGGLLLVSYCISWV
jgi:hypothetical protein